MKALCKLNRAEVMPYVSVTWLLKYGTSARSQLLAMSLLATCLLARGYSPPEVLNKALQKMPPVSTSATSALYRGHRREVALPIGSKILLPLGLIPVV